MKWLLRGLCDFASSLEVDKEQNVYKFINSVDLYTHLVFGRLMRRLRFSGLRLFAPLVKKGKAQSWLRSFAFRGRLC